LKILNIIWSFSTGGIGKCFITYSALGAVDKNITVKSVCIDLLNRNYDRKPLEIIDATLIPIKNIIDFAWIKKLNQLIQSEKPDVIFCHGFNGPIVVQIVKSVYGVKIPMICSYHGLYHAPTALKKILAPIYNNIQMLMYRLYAKRVILVENYSKKYLLSKKVPANKLVTVYNGISNDVFSGNHKVVLDLRDNAVSIGIASRLDKVKGIDYLIKALPLLRDMTNLSYHVYIIGDGQESQNLIKLSKNLRVDDQISFLGYQNHISAWLNQWDIFCLPSLFEYHSIALLEAMRAGKAIVATAVGGNPESVTNEREALLVEPKDEKTLAIALARLIESKELREDLGKAARKRFLEEFTEQIMMNNLIQALKL
jgi:glycosyltransferase involved in cell wall biosynthesis